MPHPIPFNVEEVISGYAQGYFLMAESNDDPLYWYSTNQRTLIPLDQRFHYPRSLKRVLNQDHFSTAIDRNFEGVVEGCAHRQETWISDQLKALYWALHAAGWAHSYETWQGDQLAGGILGIVIGRVFIGESMFFQIPDGSKVAMVKLVEHLRQRQFVLFDAQMPNPHLSRFGAYDVSQEDYLTLLKLGIQMSSNFLSPVAF